MFCRIFHRATMSRPRENQRGSRARKVGLRWQNGQLLNEFRISRPMLRLVSFPLARTNRHWQQRQPSQQTSPLQSLRWMSPTSEVNQLRL